MKKIIFLLLMTLSVSVTAAPTWNNSGANTAGIDSITNMTAISASAVMGPVGVGSCDASADCWASDGTNGIEYYRNFYDVSDGTCNTDVDVATAAYTDTRAVDIDFSAGTYYLHDSGGTMLDTFPAEGAINFTVTFPAGFDNTETVAQELVFKSNVLASPDFDRYRVYMDAVTGSMVFNIYSGATSVNVISTTTKWFPDREYTISTKFGTGGMVLMVDGVSEVSNATTVVPGTGTHSDFLVGLHFIYSQTPLKPLFVILSLWKMARRLTDGS